MGAKFFDSSVIGSAEKALDFIGNVLESSTEYSIIGKNLDGTILLWNEAARRLYGYEPQKDEATGFLQQIESCHVQLGERSRKMAGNRFSPERVVAKL